MIDELGSVPRMARPFRLGIEALLTAVGGLLVVVTTTMITYRMSTPAMLVAVVVPALVIAAVAGYEWWTARELGTRLSRLHLAGVGFGLLVWLMYQTEPGGVSADPSPASLCRDVHQDGVPACLSRAHTALLHSDIAWWGTGAAVLLLGLLARRSRSAAWGTAALALGGASLALHFLDAFLDVYGA